MLVTLSLLAAARTCPAEDNDAVAARVNGHEVTVGDVEHQIKRGVGDRQVDSAVLPRLRYETLRKLVDRELVLMFLEERKIAASPKDVELAISHLQQELKARGRTLDDYLKDASLNEAQLERSFRWTLSWRRMLDTYMTEKNIEKYFEGHRRQFDGTKSHVAHILWKTEQDNSELIEQARKVRDQLDASHGEAATRGHVVARPHVRPAGRLSSHLSRQR